MRCWPTVHRIAQLPTVLIHGHYDISEPVDTACDLHKRWAASRLVVVDDAGHFSGGMNDEFNAAIAEMADLFVQGEPRANRSR